MSKRQFNIKKRVSLAFFGEGWENAYIDFRPFNQPDLEYIEGLDDKRQAEGVTGAQGVKMLQDVLKDHFVAGKGLVGDDAELVDLEANDVYELPLDLIYEAIKELRGTPDPNL